MGLRDGGMRGWGDVETRGWGDGEMGRKLRITCHLSPVPCSLFPVPCSLFPVYELR